MAQVAHVDAMAGYAYGGEGNRKAVDQSQKDLDGDDGVNEAREKFAGRYGVLLYQFREVIESACYDRKGCKLRRF